MSPWNSSYVFGTDNESGWGDRYFFTYFNEFTKSDVNTSKLLEVAAFSIIFIVSVVTNLAIAVCVFRFPDMKTVTNNFVLNLAAADLLFAFSIPAVAYSWLAPSWNLGNIACKLIPYTQFVSGIVLLWTLTLISMDRYRCIVVPPYRSKLSTAQATFYSALTWILTASVFVPVLLWFRQQKIHSGEYVCTMVFPKSEAINFALAFILPVVFLACLLPMIILVYNYQKIFKKIISTKNTWASSCVMVSTGSMKSCKSQIRRQSEVSLSDIFTPWPRKFSNGGSAGSRHGSLSQHEEIRISKHIKAVRVLFLNVIMVLIMWLPITILMFLIFLDGRRPTEDQDYFLRSHHFIIALTIAFLNTITNPLLYGVLSDNFRACLVRLWCPSSQNNDQTITPTSYKTNGSFKTPRKPSVANSASEQPQDIV